MQKNWGFGIHKDRQTNFDEGDRSLWNKLRKAEPSVSLCISCGTCASACTAATFTRYSLRSLILDIQRGQLREVSNDISKCMLCGKCQLACPRGVNTRNLILAIQKLTDDASGN